MPSTDNTNFSFPGLSLKRGQPALISLLRLQPKTFATLPITPSEGTLAYITDSSVNTWGDIVSGGGSYNLIVWFDGTNWTVGWPNAVFTAVWA